MTNQEIIQKYGLKVTIENNEKKVACPVMPSQQDLEYIKANKFDIIKEIENINNNKVHRVVKKKKGLSDWIWILISVAVCTPILYFNSIETEQDRLDKFNEIEIKIQALEIKTTDDLNKFKKLILTLPKGIDDKKIAKFEKMFDSQKVKVEKMEKINRLFSEWDGRNYALAAHIKYNMHDPDSFKHVETRYSVHKDVALTLMMTFRGKNAFGGIVTHMAVATQDIETGDLTACKIY